MGEYRLISSLFHLESPSDPTEDMQPTVWMIAKGLSRAYQQNGQHDVTISAMTNERLNRK